MWPIAIDVAGSQCVYVNIYFYRSIKCFRNRNKKVGFNGLLTGYNDVKNISYH